MSHPTAGTVICLGEAMVVLRPELPGGLRGSDLLRRSVGGAEANVASALAALGVETSWVSRLGRDPLGDYVEDSLRARGVEVLAERDDHCPTGLYLKDGRSTGSTMHYYRTGSAAAAMDDRVWSDHHVFRTLSHCSIVHTSGITAGIIAPDSRLLSWLIDARDRFEFTLSVDLNWRPTLWRERGLDPLMRLIRAADVLLLGADEAQSALGSRDPEELRRIVGDRPTLVVKSDAHVATELPPTTPATSVPALHVDVVEPVGAGDGFAAGYLAGLLTGQDATRRLRLGHLVAASVLAEQGDHATSLPDARTREAILAMSDGDWADITVTADGLHHATGAAG